jgi:uncharacterized membrane protein YsdA (DUF1294 family)
MSRSRVALVLAAGLVAAGVAAWRTGVVPLAFALVHAAMSVVTLAAFAIDKGRARRGALRIPEATLHALELLGGWPGSLVGQRLLAHKTRKVPYQAVFWAIVAVHLAAWTLAAGARRT